MGVKFGLGGGRAVDHVVNYYWTLAMVDRSNVFRTYLGRGGGDKIIF